MAWTTLDTKANAAAIAMSALTACSPLWVSGQAFRAVGNDDPNKKAAPNKQGEVIVTFDTMPTKVSFDLPGHIKMITENGIPYMNGATETYIPFEGFHEGASYESWNDHQNKYSRMWIESQNNARIVVRHRCALVKGDKIAHQDKRKVAPYGPGNWTDEWYVFHPDGTHTRRIKIWNAVAGKSGMHGAEYPYELEGMYLWWGHVRGKMASDHLEDGVITLIEMDGKSKTIDFTPYPMDTTPKSGKGMYEAYGKFKHANIHLINTKSKYRPWRMGRPSGRGGGFGGETLWMSPYKPVHELVQLVPCFPAGSNKQTGYSVAGLGQMIYSDYWKRTDTSMSEIWLNGFTDSAEAAEELAAIARSWQKAPKMSLAKRNAAELHGYDVGERAYLLETSASKGAYLKIAASSDSPLVNPMFLVKEWGKGDPKLAIDGKEIPRGNDFRFGHYESLELEGGREWKDVLAVWVSVTSEKSIRFDLHSGSGASSKMDEPYRTWKSLKGTTIEARLVKTSVTGLILEKRSGGRLRINPESLSEEDRKYLKGFP